jgi:glycosyltransferase involved in cell wall biosynthesis
MIHFFPTFSKDADRSPLGGELRRTGIPFRIFAGHVRLHYRRRLSMLLRGYPGLAWFAVKSAVRSLFLSDPPPVVVALGSDIEVLVFSLLRLFRGRRRPAIVLLGFIYTARRSRLSNALRRWYFRAVLRHVQCVICHSRLEAEAYRTIFSEVTKFAFVPWGSHVDGRDAYLRAAARPYQSGRIAVMSAGRSGRDYRTLAEAVRDLEVSLTIICDWNGPLAGVEESRQIRLLRACYGDRYLEELAKSDVVVVPLAVDDISAGQMALIQAMAYGKAVVATRTPTICEYLDDGRTALLVDRGNVGQLRETVRQLADDPLLRERLGRAAQAEYEARFSLAASVQNTLTAIRENCAPV